MTDGDSLIARLAPVTLVVGKGGVGKTTIAAAIATHFAGRGDRTLVVTTDPAGTLLSAFGRPIERTLRPVSVDVTPTSTLDVWAFDTERVRDDFLAKWREPISQILDRGTYLDDEDIRGLVDAALPGADEIFGLLALGDVFGRSGDGAYRRIVVDTAPTGHTLRLLNLPRSFGALVRLLDAMQEKHRFMVRALTHRYRRDAADAFIAELRDRVETLQRVLTDPQRTAAVLVLRPEPVVVAESERYLAALGLATIQVTAVVINTWQGTTDEGAAVVGLREAAGTPIFIAPHIEVDPISSVLDEIRLLSDVTVRSSPPRRPERSEGVGLSVRDHSLCFAQGDREATGDREAPTARSLTIIGGKGGVGKTTVACAIAIQLGDEGHSTLLVSTDPAPSVGDALGIDIGDDETVVPGVPRLVARQMDATQAFTVFRTTYQERIDALFEGLTGRGIDITHDREIIRDLFSLAPPGIDELYALTVLGDTLEEGRFTHIVVDPAPTGHLLRLLDMPALAVAWAHQLMRMMLKYKEVVGLGDAAQDLLAFAKRTRALEGRLRDPARSTALLVALDEPLVRTETERLRAALVDRSVSVGGIIWNRARESTSPLPTDASLPQLFAPLRSPAPTGVTGIREWSRGWGKLSA